jgi:cytochrome b561
MQFRNSSHRFGAVSITLHWLGALGVTVMLSSGLMMARAADRTAYLPWVKFHSSVGVSIFLLLAARIAWHFSARQPVKLSDSRALNRVANLVHTALLVLIGLQLITGPIDVWSGGFALRVFDWFTVPALTGTAFKAQHDAIGDFHAWVGLVLASLVALHLVGVFKHLLLDDDDTVARMLGQVDEPGIAESARLQSDSAESGKRMP